MVQDSVADAAALLAHIEAAAIAAASFIRARADDRAHIEWRTKSATDFVSDVDMGAERLIRDALSALHPRAQILGEELSPESAANAALAFVVDPLDGTTNFLHGFREYAVSIAAAVHGELVAAAIVEVPTGDRYTAVRGGGAFRNGEPIAVSSIDEPSRALIGTGFPFGDDDSLDLYLRHFAAVAPHTAGMRRPGSAALDLVHVACGHFDAFWELSLAPWDFAAGALLVREAGGIVTTVSGGEVPLAHCSLLAGNPAMHCWLATTLAAATPAGVTL
ncbi:MAG: inositol monophosphatase [Gemmatimonadaceae bacterium]|nr:inositol monophosphatase [Gemmatimonadaceae bacterium]